MISLEDPYFNYLTRVLCSARKGPTLFTAAHYHELQPHYQSWYRPRLLPLPPRRAVDLMSDIINELGIRILQQYLDNGNVAFSPAGVGFIMAALYEGSGSRSRQQIIDSLGMPRDKNAVRVGMRDIHRRLRVSKCNAVGRRSSIDRLFTSTRQEPQPIPQD
jgi:hypothetical protein